MKEISSDIDSTIDIENKEDTFIKLRKNYFNLLLKGKKREASQLILGVIKQGITIKEIYLHVFEPALYEVGKLWERNKISVAHEHYFTHATLSIIDQLYPYIENNQKKDYSIVAVTSIGESHYLGLRMVADFFEMEGWNSYYLGINTPTDSIIKYIEEKKADILIISATLPFNVNGVTNLIKAVSSAKEIKTIVGGQAFMYDKNSWKKTGADAYATNAQSAVEIAKDLVNDKT
jgi:methanogenic corrinoid protein MtbC1